MSVPLDIQKIIDERTPESSVIEYMRGFNPSLLVRKVCSFANDIEDNGGGYIIIGVGEKEGRPEVPVRGLMQCEIGKILRELPRLCDSIEPFYEPVVESVTCLDLSDGAEKKLVVIWVPKGYDRPYRAPEDVTSRHSTKKIYVRRYSSSVVASRCDEMRLHSENVIIPYDERICFQSDIEDLDMNTMRSFLKETESSLYSEEQPGDLITLARDMRIVAGSPENEKPLNVGILMFSSNPQKYFPYARIEVVFIPDPRGTNMIEQTFTGTLQYQLRSALQYIRNIVIKEAVIKHSDRAEAERFFNYPYEAVEEILTNAVYHRSYQEHEPVTVRIENDFIEITSVPGFDRSITDDDVKKLQLRGIVYRNRRIGEFLKELHLTEGRNTGFPNAFSALRANGSSLPEFIMNDNRDYLRVKIPVHPYFRSAPAASRDAQYLEKIVVALNGGALTLTELAHTMGYKGISRKLKMGTEVLLRERRIESVIADGQIRYRNIL